jgi:cob(I)alamin adenosyltransferase
MSIKKDIAPREYRGPRKRIKKGLLILYTGNGKGKSTAAFGAVFRSLGRGFTVGVVQFIKGEWVSGEIKALDLFKGKVEYHSEGEGFTWETKSLARDVTTAQRGWERCLKLLKEDKHDVYLFDELLYVLKYKFLRTKDVLKGLKLRNPDAHVILTGRDAPPELVKMADLVTEMKEIKHPFREGLRGTKGLEY